MPKVKDLYNWLWSVIDESLPPVVQDYRRCIKERKAVQTRTAWAIILQGVSSQKFDPYPYLNRYLTEDEVKEVLQLPLRSQVQIDYIIALIDEHGACDDALRKQIYSLFGVEGIN